MGLTFTAWTPYYEYLGAIEFEAAELAQRQNEVGTGLVTGVRGVDPGRLGRDAILVSSYADDAADVVLREAWLVRRRQRRTESRTTVVDLQLRDLNHLLTRRIIAYYAGSAQAAKTGTASQLMVDFARQQLTTATDATRNAPILIPDADAFGSTQSVACSRDNLIDVLRDIAEAEAQRGTWIGFGVSAATVDGIGVDGLAPTFRVYQDLRGVDRRNEISLSAEAGGLSTITVDEDWTTEATRSYIGGAGEGAARMVAQAERADLGVLGPFALIENWLDATNIKTASYLTARADAELRTLTARARYQASIAFSSGLRWGRDIGFGDRLYIGVDDVLADGRVDAYSIKSSNAGTVVSAVVEGYL